VGVKGGRDEGNEFRCISIEVLVVEVVVVVVVVVVVAKSYFT